MVVKIDIAGCQQIKDMSSEQVMSPYSRVINDYKVKNFTIFSMDAYVASKSTGCGIYNFSRNQRFMFLIPGKSSPLLEEL